VTLFVSVRTGERGGQLMAKTIGMNGLFRVASTTRRFVELMGERFLRRQEGRAAMDALGAEREGGDQAAAGGEPAGSKTGTSRRALSAAADQRRYLAMHSPRPGRRLRARRPGHPLRHGLPGDAGNRSPHEFHKRRVVEATSEQTVHSDVFAINWPPRSPCGR